MKKIVITVLVATSSIFSFSQGTLKCGNSDFQFGVLTTSEKSLISPNPEYFEDTYFEKTDDTFTFYLFGINKINKDTTYAYSDKVNLKTLKDIRSTLVAKDDGTTEGKPYKLELMDMTFSKKHIESMYCQCESQLNQNKKGNSMLVLEFASAAKRDEVMQLLKPYVNSEYR